MNDEEPQAYVVVDGLGGPWLAIDVGHHTCGTGPDGHYGAHEQGCGLEPVASVAQLHAALTLQADYLALTSALGYGDDQRPDFGGEGPAASPRDLIEPLQQAMADAAEWWEAPVWCDDCDQYEAPRSCRPCHGSGCGPGTASGAYAECDLCAGDGRDHQPYTPTGTWRHLPHAPYVAIDGPPDYAARALAALTDHRRLQNARSCSGCGWKATAPGRNGDPGTMQARHAQFNEHLRDLILTALDRPAS